MGLSLQHLFAFAFNCVRHRVTIMNNIWPHVPLLTIQTWLNIMADSPGIEIPFMQMKRWWSRLICLMRIPIMVRLYGGTHIWVNWLVACSLQWRHNERDGVSNHQPHDCLLNLLFRRRSKKTSKLRVTGLCAGNSLVNSPHKRPIMRKMFPFDDVIMSMCLLAVHWGTTDSTSDKLSRDNKVLWIVFKLTQSSGYFKVYLHYSFFYREVSNYNLLWYVCHIRAIYQRALSCIQRHPNTYNLLMKYETTYRKVELQLRWPIA